MKRIAIVGGGIAGVAAAYEIAKRRRAGAAVEAVLYEASTRLGGIVETVREAGFTIEGGPDGWVTEKPWARELAEELGLKLWRAESLNDSRLLVEALAEVVTGEYAATLDERVTV